MDATFKFYIHSLVIDRKYLQTYLTRLFYLFFVVLLFLFKKLQFEYLPSLRMHPKLSAKYYFKEEQRKKSGCEKLRLSAVMMRYEVRMILRMLYNIILSGCIINLRGAVLPYLRCRHSTRAWQVEKVQKLLRSQVQSTFQHVNTNRPGLM